MKRDPDKTKLSTADMAAAGEEVHEKREESRDKATADVSIQSREEQLAPLLSREEADDLRARWGSIQTDFVDEPRHSVEQADELVAEIMRRLAETFSKERAQLESQWSEGDKVSTEDLRLALRKYRSFFERFLSL